MAAMSTVLTEYANNGDSKKYTTAGHTASLVKYVISKRKEASSPTSTATYTLSIVQSAVDSDAVQLDARNVIDISFRGPVAGTAAGRTAVRAIASDYIASDEFIAAMESLSHPG